MSVTQLLKSDHVSIFFFRLYYFISLIQTYISGDIIIERWLPYGVVGERKTIVQRAESARDYPPPHNVIIQYESTDARVVRQFQHLGVTQEDPHAYLARYGAQLLDAHTLVQEARAAGVVEDIVNINIFL